MGGLERGYRPGSISFCKHHHATFWTRQKRRLTRDVLKFRPHAKQIALVRVRVGVRDRPIQNVEPTRHRKTKDKDQGRDRDEDKD